MPRSKSSQSLRRLCLVAVATNLDSWCDDFVANFEDEELLYAIGPYHRLSQSLINDLMDLMKQLNLMRRSNIMLLVHSETDKLDLSRSGDNEIVVLFALNFAIRVCKNLQQLDLSFCDKISAPVLVEMASSLSSLETLKLTSTSCDDTVLAALGSHCPELRNLDVSHCRVTDAGISSLCINTDDVENPNSSRCCKLSSLLVNATNVTDRGAMVAIKHLPDLRVFDYPNNCRCLRLLYGDTRSDWPAVLALETLYYSCCEPSNVSLHTIEMARVTCPNVNKIELNNCNMADDVLLVLSNFEHLTELSLNNRELNHNTELSDWETVDEELPLSTISFADGVRPLLRARGARLTTLVLVTIPWVDVDVIASCCPRVQHLELLFTVGYQRYDASPSSSSSNKFRDLRTLRVFCDDEEYDMPVKQMRSLLAHCSRLEDVFLQRCQALTNMLFNEVLKSNRLPQLTRVTLERCDEFTGTSVKRLFSLDNPLSSLKIWFCRGFTRANYSFLQDLVVRKNLDTTIEWKF